MHRILQHLLSVASCESTSAENHIPSEHMSNLCIWKPVSGWLQLCTQLLSCSEKGGGGRNCHLWQFSFIKLPLGKWVFLKNPCQHWCEKSVFSKKKKYPVETWRHSSSILFFSNESSTVIYQLVFSVPPSTEGFMENTMSPDFIRNILRQNIYDEDTRNPETSECDRLKLDPTSLTCKCCILEKLFLWEEQKYLWKRREIFLERYWDALVNIICVTVLRRFFNSFQKVQEVFLIYLKPGTHCSVLWWEME